MSIARGCVPLVCLVVAACGGGTLASQKPMSPAAPESKTAQAAPSKPPAEASGDKTAEAADAAPSDRPVVTLLTPGAEPRQKLRYHIAKNHKERMKMVTRMDMRMALGGNPMPHTSLPPMAADMTLEVTNVTADGKVDYTFSIDHFATEPDPSTSKDIAARLDATLAHMDGTTGSATVTSRGFTTRAEVHVPPGVDPTTAQLMKGIEDSIHQLANPLPKEPVGVGAKWNVTMHPVIRGMAVDQTYHCKLLSRQGDHFKLDIAIEQSASPQTMHLPNLPPDAKVELVSLASIGAAKANLDLSHLVPIHSLALLESKSAMQVTSGGQTQPMNTDVKMSMEVTPEKP